MHMYRPLFVIIVILATLIIAVSGYRGSESHNHGIEQRQQKEDVAQRQWLAVYQQEDAYAMGRALKKATDRTKAIAMEEAATRTISSKVTELSYQPGFLVLPAGQRFERVRAMYEQSWRAKSTMRDSDYRMPFKLP